MKKLIAAILGVFLANALFGVISIQNISSEGVFYSTPVEDRSFHVLMREDGTQPDFKELFIGSGDFAIPAEDTAQQSDFNWVVNQEENFSISYNLAGSGNLVFSIGSVSLLDQPLNLTSQIFIGNDNSTGSSQRGVSLTDLAIDGEVIPDIVTSGPNEFKGVVVSSFDTQSWELTGKITFTGNALFHDSDVPIYGVSVPEPSSYASILSILVLAVAVTKRKL